MSNFQYDLENRTVIIDFDDSFTYNIYELLRKVGADRFTIVPIGLLEAEETSGSIIHRIKNASRIILSPGPGVPSDYPSVYKLLNRLYDNHAAQPVPLLGICLGHQIIYSWCGGRLKNLRHVIHGRPAEMKIINEHSLFRNIPEQFTAGLYHSWAADRPLPGKLLVTAESADGTIMAIKHKNLPVSGIQFHPESFISEYGDILLTNFLSL